MISRKWLYSYRLLTARLHEVGPTTASQTSGFSIGLAASQEREISVHDELTENQPAKPALCSRPEEKYECLNQGI
jgi:hypothetical protein